MFRFICAFILLSVVFCFPADKPLLLEEEDNQSSQTPLKEPKIKYPGPPADNSRCFVCHANYEDEKLSVTHLRANVGCVICHGESDKHSSDEDNITAPDKMYPHKGAIRFKCLTCHDWRALIESDKTKKDLKESPDHRAVLLGENKDGKFCMDCHSEHKLSWRTRIWDKRTGKLLVRDGTPLMLERGQNSNTNSVIKNNK
jgi:hypothetical protein